MFTYIKYFLGGVFAGIIVLLGFLYFAHNDNGEFGSGEVEIVSAALADEENIYQSRRNAITRAIQAASPAVVGINVTQVKEYRYRSPFWDDPFFRNFFPDRIYRQKVQNLGSGFIISSDGYIVTNEHVVHYAVEIIVTMADGSQHNAQIVGTDYLTDVALLKIDGGHLEHLRWGDSNDIIIGEWAIAIGNPFGLFSNNAHPTVTVGVISAVDRDFQLNREGKLYQNMIQTDASINPGNSGGPLLNSEGVVVGINTMIFSESGGSIGLGFAIPSNKVQEVIEILKEAGTVNRNYWIGISIQDITPLIAMALGLEEPSGVVVTDIDLKSPADRAGMKVADIIKLMDGRKVIDKESIQRVLNTRDYRVGDSLSFQVYRDGKHINLKLELEALPR